MVAGGWPHVFAGGASCLFCGSAERTVVVPQHGGSVGLCEACAVQAHLAWREEGGDELFETPDKVTLVKVVACRVEGGDRSERGVFTNYSEIALVPIAYEFGMVAGDDGSLDFPTASVVGGDVTKAALAALEGTGLSTWQPFVEVLYTGHSPRGSRVVVVLLAAWAEAGRSKVLWRGWPPWDHARSLSSFYVSFREVFALRLWKHKASGRTSVPSVQLREAAVKYVEVQASLRAGEKVDTSMVPYLKSSMTEDEKLVAESLAEQGRLSEELSEQVVEEGGAETDQPTEDATFSEESNNVREEDDDV